MTNPFTSETFSKIWLKHFHKRGKAVEFDFIKGVKFIKSGSYFVNIGMNLTKGLDYSLQNADDYKGKTFLIYDVPAYFRLKNEIFGSLGMKKSFQYKGFLMNLEGFNSSEEYIKANFSSKNRREFRSNMRRLEECFDISYDFIFGGITKERFDVLWSQFFELLNYRYSEKEVDYHHLSPEKWNYYTELVFELLNESKASLLVIYNKNQPIGITLNFHAEDILFEAITVFDPDYFKFSIGKTSIIKLIDWCIQNQVKISDFSKGAFDYKYKWANQVYDFNYHVLYDKSSFFSRITANFIYTKLEFKRFLREKKLNVVYRKLMFKLRGKTINKQNVTLKNLKTFNNDGSYEEVDHESSEFRFLKKYVNSFLFANPQPESNISVFKAVDEKSFVITSQAAFQKISFS